MRLVLHVPADQRTRRTAIGWAVLMLVLAIVVGVVGRTW